MGSRQKTYAVAFALLLTGCGTKAPEATNEYAIALAAIEPSWMDECQGLGDKPDRAVGTLLQDFVELTKVAVPCRVNHNALREYLQPLIDKAKAGESK